MAYIGDPCLPQCASGALISDTVKALWQAAMSDRVKGFMAGRYLIKYITSDGMTFRVQLLGMDVFRFLILFVLCAYYISLYCFCFK